MFPQILDTEAKPHHNDQGSKNLQGPRTSKNCDIYIYIYIIIHICIYIYAFLCIRLEVNLTQTTMLQIEMSAGSGICSWINSLYMSLAPNAQQVILFEVCMNLPQVKSLKLIQTNHWKRWRIHTTLCAGEDASRSTA